MALCLNDYTAQSYVSITVFYALIPEPFYAATLNISFNKVSIIQALQELLNNRYNSQFFICTHALSNTIGISLS